MSQVFPAWRRAQIVKNAPFARLTDQLLHALPRRSCEAHRFDFGVEAERRATTASTGQRSSRSCTSGPLSKRERRAIGY